jgi:hypothetical protein
MRTKKKVPVKWFKEMKSELTMAIFNSIKHVNQLQVRFDNYPTEFDAKNHIDKEYIEKWLKEAKEDEASGIARQKRDEFMEKYTPDKTKSSNLVAAKLEAKIFSLTHSDYYDDEHNYDLLHKISDKYFLCNSEINKLMDHFCKLGLLD